MSPVKTARVKTGGGRFDPAADPVYFTVVPSGADFSGLHHWNLIAVSDCRDEHDPHLRRHLDAGNNVLLDSGIFWLTNRHARDHGTTMNEALGLDPEAIDGFEDLWDRYVTIVSALEPDLWGYIELDQGGADNKRKTRSRLEALGLKPIPVYHPLNDGWDYFDELCSGYDRICFGNIVQANRETRKHLLATMWERKRRYPGVWIHVLGLTANDVTTAYPPSSCDSSSWVYAIRFGAPSSPGARGMGASFDKFSRGFSVDTATENVSPTGTDKGVAFLCAEAVFTHEGVRAQTRAQRDLFGSLWPAANKKEGVRQ